MQNALHIKTTVLPGQRIEITAPLLNEGDAIDVFLVLPTPSSRGSRAALEIIRRLHGRRLFETAGDVDRYLDEERDSWDR
jgi:hypothetical protein